MCGIVGCWSKNNNVNPDNIISMMDEISHRGPDGDHYWISNNYTIGLGHKRLAIIDLTSDADQPMVSCDGSARIVYNGEIYNHQELREQLLAEGMSFHTYGSDTEVLLNGYLAWGIDKLLKKLIGMFAFALIDHKAQQLHLVRDRVGIKPLAILRRGEDVFFASEIKAFMSIPGFTPELDKTNLYHHFSFRSLPAPRSLFKGIEKVKPGQIISFDLDKKTEKRRIYWSPLCAKPSAISGREEAVSEMGKLLNSAISYRLVADVPVSIFLSGGVDSTFLLSQMTSEIKAPQSYTAIYPEQKQYDEGHIAREFSTTYNTRHTEVPVYENEYTALLPKISYFQDEPISAPICIPVYLLSKAVAKDGNKVVLTGEGSDELFVGYESWIKILRLEQVLSKLPNWVISSSSNVAQTLFKSFTPVTSRPMEMLGRLAQNQPLFWGGAMDFCENDKKNLFQKSFLEEFPDTYEDIIEPIRQEFLEQRPKEDITAWMSYIDLKFRLPELMLPRVDKMGMANSIEGRVPFLDHRLIEFYLSLPQSIREAASLEGKGLFKELAANVLGKEFVYQKKRGFQAPVKQWKTGAFGNFYNPLLQKFSQRTGIFDEASIKGLLDRKNDRLYFGLINFMLWYVNYIEDVLPENNLKFRNCT